MTMSITIKRDTSGKDHDAEVRIVEFGKTMATHTLKPGEEQSINIWSGRSLAISEAVSAVAVAEPAPAAEPILQFFTHAHLPPALAAVSRPFCELAEHICLTLPRNAERTVALRKLLEAKDAGVRAHLSKV